MRTAAGPPKGLDLEASSILAKAQGDGIKDAAVRPANERDKHARVLNEGTCWF